MVPEAILEKLEPMPKLAEKSKYKSHSAVAAEESDEEALVVGHAGMVGSSVSWIVDSGATYHMCNSRWRFVRYSNLLKPVKVTVGDGRSLKAVGRGSVNLLMKLPDSTTQLCKLRDVLYVPNLSYNLISVSKASEVGKVAHFDEAGCRILNAEKRVIATAVRCGCLYFLDCRSLEQASIAELKEDVWHRRFGHLSVGSLKQLAADGLVDDFDFDRSKEISFCEPCVKGKHHRNPFPSCGGTRAAEPLELVHTDVCGKINVRSISGAEYFLTFVDDKTRYVWVYFLKQKEEVFSRFVEWKAMVEKASGRKLKRVRSDNGGEYTSTRFKEYLRSEGVTHELTGPKTPQQNDVAERFNHTLMEMTRSMLVGAGLSQRLWAGTLSTAVYLKNRSPSRAVTKMTPFEAYHGSKPSVKNLRAFGCVCYAHISKDERKKLDPVAKKCVLIGYGTEVKGYRLYDPSRDRILYSRDVKFNESEFGLEKEHDESKPVHYVERDCELKSDGGVSNCGISDDGMPGGRVLDGDMSRDDGSNGCVSSDGVSCGDVSDGEELDGVSAERQKDSDPEPRRSQRVRHRPDYYIEGASVATNMSENPVSFHEAVSGPNSVKWKQAMEREMRSLRENEVWELVELPPDRKVVGSKWVFKVKTDEVGRVDRYKARLVAQGFSQTRGMDYDETFCPVVRMESLRTVISLAASNGLELHQLDVTTAFFNGKLDEEVYMKQPEGFVEEGHEDLVCLLKRSLYGLKQSPRSP